MYIIKHGYTEISNYAVQCPQKPLVSACLLTKLQACLERVYEQMQSIKVKCLVLSFHCVPLFVYKGLCDELESHMSHFCKPSTVTKVSFLTGAYNKTNYSFQVFFSSVDNFALSPSSFFKQLLLMNLTLSLEGRAKYSRK